MDRAKNTMISAAKDLCDLAMRVQRPTKVDELATNMKTAKSLGDSVSPRETRRIEFSGTCPSRKLYPCVAMMQSGQDWRSDDRTKSFDGSS
jgi:hypothetical protein